MKKILFFIVIIPVMMLFTACPVGTSFPLCEPGSSKIDKQLLGHWKTDADAEVLEVMISQSSNNFYEVYVMESGEFYIPNTSYFKGWVTTIDGVNFIECKPDDEDKYYLYAYKVVQGKVLLYSVSLKVGGIDAVTSTKAYRDEVKASLKFADCLTDGIEYYKVN